MAILLWMYCDVDTMGTGPILTRAEASENPNCLLHSVLVPLSPPYSSSCTTLSVTPPITDITPIREPDTAVGEQTGPKSSEKELRRKLCGITLPALQQACAMFPFLLLSLCVAMCCGRYEHEDWTDPTDMFNYDAATGKMIKQKHNTEEKVKGVCEKEAEESCPGSSVALMVEKEQTRQTVEEPRQREVMKLLEGSSNPVFRRFLRKILNEAERFGLPEDSSSEVYYNAEMVLTKQMLVEIQKFIDDEDWNLGALEEALIRMLVKFRSHSVKEWWMRLFEDHIGIDLPTISMILLSITCIVSVIATELWSRIGWFTQVKRICMLSFLVSVAWNWMYLYKVAFAERQAELTKLHKFDGCGEKMSWSESLLEWWRGAATFQNDPCEEYFKSLMINPVLMVPPTKALALTFTDFITEPLKHIGKAIGEFLKGLLAEIPVFYQLPVLIFIVVIIMVTCYGAVGQVPALRNNRNPPRERLPPAEPQRERLPPAEPQRERLPPAEPQREKLPPAEPQRERLPPAEPHRGRLPPAEPHRERLPPSEPHRERLPPSEPHRERLPPAGPHWERLPPAGPHWERLPPAGPHWERLPPAGLPRPHYGNVEGWHQPQYYIEPVPVYSNPRMQRPENLQAMDIHYDGNHVRPPGFTDVDFPLRDPEGEQGRRKEDVIEQKPFQEQRGNIAEPIEENPARTHRRTEELKERSDRPRQIVENSSELQREEEETPEQKSADRGVPYAIQEVTVSTEYKRCHSRERAEPGDQNADHRKGEEPDLQQRRENPIEELSHGEPTPDNGASGDKSAENTGASNPTEKKSEGEEVSNIWSLNAHSSALNTISLLQS
ncbi:chloride channel CLIC-like protein 1 [Dendropsophus ebraccatus]|uniref:chloride channel CLIC-like protein 1 n=1 Tax=Dendropsophus ebraccatus TaxID=150705 RepID=UPI003831FBE8